MHLRGAQQIPSVIETDFELREKWMPMAGERHVLVAIETHAHRPSRVMCRQRGERGGRGGLRFLAAETAAHARHLHDDFVRGQMQNMRDDLLHFGRMLRGGSHEDRAILAALGPRRLRFQIKMFLSAKFKFAFDESAAPLPKFSPASPRRMKFGSL